MTRFFSLLTVLLATIAFARADLPDANADEPILCVGQACYQQFYGKSALDWRCYRGGIDVGDKTTLAGSDCPGNFLVTESQQVYWSWMPVKTPAWRKTPLSPTGIKWQAPTVNTDGSALDDLAGFKIYCNEELVADMASPEASVLLFDERPELPVTCDVAAYDNAEPPNIGPRSRQVRVSN